MNNEDKAKIADEAVEIVRAIMEMDYSQWIDEFIHGDSEKDMSPMSLMRSAFAGGYIYGMRMQKELMDGKQESSGH